VHPRGSGGVWAGKAVLCPGAATGKCGDKVSVPACFTRSTLDSAPWRESDDRFSVWPISRTIAPAAVESRVRVRRSGEAQPCRGSGAAADRGVAEWRSRAPSQRRTQKHPVIRRRVRSVGCTFSLNKLSMSVHWKLTTIHLLTVGDARLAMLLWIHRTGWAKPPLVAVDDREQN